MHTPTTLKVVGAVLSADYLNLEQRRLCMTYTLRNMAQISGHCRGQVSGVTASDCICLQTTSGTTFAACGQRPVTSGASDNCNYFGCHRIHHITSTRRRYLWSRIFAWRRRKRRRYFGRQLRSIWKRGISVYFLQLQFANSFTFHQIMFSWYLETQAVMETQ